MFLVTASKREGRSKSLKTLQIPVFVNCRTQTQGKHQLSLKSTCLRARNLSGNATMNNKQEQQRRNSIIIWTIASTTSRTATALRTHKRKEELDLHHSDDSNTTTSLMRRIFVGL